MTRTDEYDVFLCHSSSDKPEVRELARLLREQKLRVFLDEDELMPGRPWMEGLEAAIEKSRAALILYGSSQIGPWTAREMRAFLAEFVRRDVAVIPVLLPGAPDVAPELPVFLRQFQWVDLRAGFAAGLERLLDGIRGGQPRSPSTPAPHPSRSGTEPPLPSRRSLVPFLAAAGAVALVAVGVAFLQFGHRGERQELGLKSESTARAADAATTVAAPGPTMIDAGLAAEAPDSVPAPEKRDAGKLARGLKRSHTASEPLHPQPGNESKRLVLVTLTVRSEPPAQIQFASQGQHLVTGRSPLTADVPMGVVDIQVSDPAQGWLRREALQLNGDRKAVEHTIVARKSTLIIEGPRWTPVTMDGRSVGYIPWQKKVFEGTHAVRFACTNGKVDSQDVAVDGTRLVTITARCE